MKLLTAAAVLLLLCPCSHAGAETALVQELLLFLEERPIVVRLHLRVGSEPAHRPWQDHLAQLFRFLDADGDGTLSQVEAGRAPIADQLTQQLYGTLVEPAAAPAWEDLDTAPADGRISPSELIAYYRQHGLGPLQVEVSRRVGARDSLSDLLFMHLDTDRDGALSQSELQATRALLGSRDLDEDEVLSLAELGLAASHAGVAFARPGDPGSGSLLPVVLAGPGDRVQFSAQFLARHDRDRDGRVTREEGALERRLFARLDHNGDQALDAAELAAWAGAAPQRQVDLHLDLQAGRRTGEPQVLLLPGARVEVFLGMGGTPRRRPVRQGQQAEFRSADRDRNGRIDAREAHQPPFTFVALLRLADRDGDNALSAEEHGQYLALLERAMASPALLSVSDRGRSLFEVLDQDRDGRLAPRELALAWARLSSCDADGDGLLTRVEVPRQLHLTVSRGLPPEAERLVPPPGYGPAVAVGRPTAGPLWFRKMDRNGDGDVSRREFLGPDEEFMRIDTDGDGLLNPDEAERTRRQAR